MPTNAELLSRRADASCSRRRPCDADLGRPRPQCRNPGCRGQALCRLCRRHRGPQHRTMPSEDHAAAAGEQMQRFTHTCFQVLMYEPASRLPNGLNALAPIQGRRKTHSSRPAPRPPRMPSRSRARRDGRSGVIAFTGAFHGRTVMASAMTGKVAPYKKGLGPVLSEVLACAVPGTAARRHRRGCPEISRLHLQGRC